MKRDELYWNSAEMAKPKPYVPVVVAFCDDVTAVPSTTPLPATYDDVLNTFFDWNYNDLQAQPTYWAYLPDNL